MSSQYHNPSEQIDQTTATTLLEDLKSTNPKTKINAIHSLKGISFALGRERTRSELIPFLAESIDEEEDEVLIELAKVFGNFLECVGGKAYVNVLFSILENLLCVDEPNIRNETINSIKLICKAIPNISEIESDIIDIIKRLSQSQIENQKISALHLIAFIYELLQNEKHKKECRLFISQCISEKESFIIKRELANSLNSYIIYLPIEQIKAIINAFITDKNNDNIKMTIMDLIISLKTHPSLNELIEFITGIINKLSIDEKWRVKLTVGDKATEILKFKCISSKLRKTIVDVYCSFLTSNQSELKNICCIKLEEIAEKTSNDDIFDKILTNLNKLTKDTEAYVRGSLASNLLKITPIIGLKKTNEIIMPIFLELIKEEDHDIRMSLIKTLDKLNKVIRIDNIIQSILPSFVEINSNKSWRIRIQIIEIVPILAKSLEKKTFIEKIFPISIASLTDPVFAVREATCKLIKELYSSFMGEEYEKRVLEKIKEMKKSTSYLVRNTVVMFIKLFCEGGTLYRDFLEKKLADIVFELCKDKISNVRLNCAGALKEMRKICVDKDNVKLINEYIEIFKNDSDKDVVKMIK